MNQNTTRPAAIADAMARAGEEYDGAERRITERRTVPAAAPAAGQAGLASELQKDIDSIADELEDAAAPYGGDFADTVNGCAEALRQIASRAGSAPTIGCGGSGKCGVGDMPCLGCDNCPAAPVAADTEQASKDAEDLIAAATQLREVPHWAAQASVSLLAEIAGRMLKAAPLATPADAGAGLGSLVDTLTDFLRREMPAGTVICRPDWWAMKIARAITAGQSPAPVTAEPAQSIHENEEVRQAVAEGLRGLWGCGRVWSAWNVGTMGEEDFYAADSSDECIDQMIHAIAFLIAPAPADRDAIRAEALEEAIAAHKRSHNWHAVDTVRALKSMERAADAAETRDAKGGEQ